MIPKGSFVKAIFKNSTQVEGLVESWSDEISILSSEDGKSKFIIFHTKEDIIAVKVSIEPPTVKPHKKFEEVVQQFKEVQAQPSDDDLRLKKLAELKNLMNEQEKKIITEKVREHTISDVRLPQYGLPFITQKPRAK